MTLAEVHLKWSVILIDRLGPDILLALGPDILLALVANLHFQLSWYNQITLAGKLTIGRHQREFYCAYRRFELAQTLDRIFPIQRFPNKGYFQHFI